MSEFNEKLENILCKFIVRIWSMVNAGGTLMRSQILINEIN